MKYAKVARSGSWKLVFSLSLLLSAALGQAPPHPQLTVAVYDVAGIGPKTLERSERIVEAILLASGLQPKWIAGPPAELDSIGTDFTARTPRECLAAPIPSILRVQILRHAPPGMSPQALGFSLPCARAGVQVTIYADRAALACKTGGPTFGRVLAYSIAHELGHVLLHSYHHETNGLMKAVWSKSDWQRAAVTDIPFSPVDVQRIAAFYAGTANCSDFEEPAARTKNPGKAAKPSRALASLATTWAEQP